MIFLLSDAFSLKFSPVIARLLIAKFCRGFDSSVCCGAHVGQAPYAGLDEREIYAHAAKVNGFDGLLLVSQFSLIVKGSPPPELKLLPVDSAVLSFYCFHLVVALLQTTMLHL